MNEQEYEPGNSRVSLGPLDLKAETPIVRFFLQVLPNIQPTLSLPI